MGNWHCIPDGCGRVIYREYLPPQIRYRYKEEEWQYIDGDNYSIEENPGGQSEGVWYVVTTFQNADTNSQYRTHRVRGAVRGIGFRYVGRYGSRNEITGWLARLNAGSASQSSVSRVFYLQTGVTPPGHYDIRIINIKRQDGQPENQDCTLTITNQDRVVFKQSFDECPEVEKLPCRLSDVTKEIKIEKIPWLKRIEVVPYAYDVRLGGLVDSDNYGFILAKKKIPDKCLNIYLNNVTATIPNDFVQLANQPENLYNQIAQICSADGCPPPEYQVICDCDCKECPTGTCPVLCGDCVCCYDTETGLSVESIAKNEYCGEVD